MNMNAPILTGLSEQLERWSILLNGWSLAAILLVTYDHHQEQNDDLVAWHRGARG